MVVGDARCIELIGARARAGAGSSSWPGCVADGETIDEAIAEARDAFNAWTMAEMEDKGDLPAPKTYSGQFVQRIPKTLHMRLAKRAAREEVCLNQLAATLLARGLAER